MNTNINYDVVIVGAGVQGAATALEAIKNNYRVLLLEQYAEPAKGTSSKSSKLIHGGLRYLESFEFGLVRECLHDQHRLLRDYSDLVSLQKFHIPIYKSTSRSRIIIRLGLTLYAFLGGLKKHNRFRKLKKSEWADLDGVKTDELLAVYQYYDAQTDDAALTRRLVEQFQQLGGDVQYNAKFSQAAMQEKLVTASYKQNDKEYTVTARMLVNAAGPWVNHVVDKCHPESQRIKVDLVQGTHIELEGSLEKGIYYLEAPQDQRAIFAMPWKGRVMFGTTEHVHEGPPEDCRPTDKEINYLLDVYNHYFTDGKVKTRDDVLEAWAGLRVLPESKNNPFKRSRETLLIPNQKEHARLISVYGGKLTSHHSMAKKLVKKIQNYID